MIMFTLDLKPGSKVIEAGTGSGSLSHAILRSIVPTGHLYTFDFHEQRSKIAASEFLDHGYGTSVVSCGHRDVCADGFGDIPEPVDAVFLDLPSPWKAIPFAKDKLVSGGRLAVFSPCIEQIQQTATTMRQLSFTHIRVQECIQQRYTVKEMKCPALTLTMKDYQCVNEPDVNADTEDADDDENSVPIEGKDIPLGAFPITPTPGHTGYLLFGTIFLR